MAWRRPGPRALRGRARRSSSGRHFVTCAVPEPSDWRELHGSTLVDGVRLVRWQSDSLKELNELSRGQVSPGTGGNALHPERAKSHAAQVEDRDPDRIHHLANHMIETFVQHDLDDDALAGLAHQARLVWNYLTIFDHDAVREAPKLHIGRPAVGDDVVLLGELIPRVHHPVRNITVVREQEQPLCLAVKATYRIDALRHIDQVHHGPALALILHGRDKPARLVQHDEPWALAAEDLAVDPDLVVRRVDLGAHLRHDSAVNGHAPGPDHRFRRPPAGDAP